MASGYQRYGDLKRDLAEALIELLRPVRERRKALAADPGAVAALLGVGAEKARAVAGATYARAADAMEPGQSVLTDSLKISVSY